MAKADSPQFVKAEQYEPSEVRDYWAIERILQMDNLAGLDNHYPNGERECRTHLSAIRNEFRDRAINKVFDRICTDDTPEGEQFVLFDPVTHYSELVEYDGEPSVTRRDAENVGRLELATDVVDRVIDDE